MDARTKLERYGLYDSRFEHDACGVGFVCNIKGGRSHTIVRQGLEILNKLSHRGATGADPKTGDGAGILIQIPHEFLSDACKTIGIELPDRGEYGSGMIFLPKDESERAFCKDLFKKVTGEEGQALLGWREVPVDDTDIGKTARDTKPVIEQVFIGRNGKIQDVFNFERKLYVIRKRMEKIVREAGLKDANSFYITNISSRTFTYKGLLMPSQVGSFFKDLSDKRIESAICMVHSRYSTNTFPTWNLAQPFRFLAHNGEINTLRGNINWMRSREGMLNSKLFGKDLAKILPVISAGGSDSASLDNVFELLVLAGRSLPHAMMMLIPAAWESDKEMNEKTKQFYQYNSSLMEPWDGPAAIAYTDGTRIGACLDRNGLRPARYIVTRDGAVAMASEVGVLDIEPENILRSGRLEPGKIFFVDTALGRIVDDAEIKKDVATLYPYGTWLKNSTVTIDDIPHSDRGPGLKTDILTELKAFGYTREDLKTIIKPMADKAQEPVGSMGNDTPHAVLSKKTQLLYSYFKQLFAQVTNPPIDPIREEIVMSLNTYLGPEKNLLEETPGHCHKLKLKKPVLSDEETSKIRNIGINGFRTKTIRAVFDIRKKNGLYSAINRICKESAKAIKQGYTFIILSDRGIDRYHAAIPALLAASGVHQHLVHKYLRTQVSIIVESGEPREVHHFALLFGYGADCVNPYMAYEAAKKLARDGELTIDERHAVDHYIKAVHKGILKILSKMGISTIQSYRGAQIFEALGLGGEVIDKCFAGTVSRIGGIGFDTIQKECVTRHSNAYPENGTPEDHLETGGVYQWKKDGETHLWNPDTIASLQDAARNNDYERYLEFASLINDQSAAPCTIRSLLSFKDRPGIPIDEVESVDMLARRFATGAMSFGSISRSAHETLALAMNTLGGRSNTGEGGEDPSRFGPLPDGRSTRSAVKQVASGRFGVTTNYLVNADELQIKIAQGAKPGEGGQLPGHKVSAIIARTRYTTPGVTLISPPPHHDIYSIEDLAQLIFDLKNVNPGARISVKLVSEIGVGTVAAGVAKGHADMILISGGDGGTGASPLSSIRHAGLPWELGLSEAHQTLVMNDLRSRVRLQTDGQIRTGRDVAIAALLGAEEFGFSTAALIVCGCVMLRHCNLNNCSVGIATQNDILEKRFTGKPEHLVNYFRFVAKELRQIMSSLGFRTLDEMVGRTDLLEMNKGILPGKAGSLDLSRILYKPEISDTASLHCTIKQDHGIEDVLDRRIISRASPTFKERGSTRLKFGITNKDRSTGAMLSGEICKNFGEDGLPDDTLRCEFKGIAGQSFGAFLAHGVTFELEGMANDYVGKGISGGKIIIYPDKKSVYTPRENIIIGNTAFYGAINGEAYIRGSSGERFCIRNSGLLAVVEGVGDHGCEYMTGGRVIVLGKTGRNFGAGMSGGIAYVYDPGQVFKNNCNMEMVDTERLDENDMRTLAYLLHNHREHTGSTVAAKILGDLAGERNSFVKVMPLEYKRILAIREEEVKLGIDEEGD